MQQKYYLNAFAVSGDITPDIPDAADPNNYVSYLDGFTFDYQRDLVTDSLAKSILRININAIMNDATTNIKNYQENGTPEFITAAQNGGTAFSYRIYAMVRYSASGTAPFVLYMNILDNNTNLPTATNSGWMKMPTAAFPAVQGPSFSAGATITGTSAGTFNGITGSATINNATFSAWDTLGFNTSTNSTLTVSSGSFYGAPGISGATVNLPPSSNFVIQFDGVNWRVLAASPDVQGFATVASVATKVPLSHMTLSGSGYNSGTGNFSASVSFTPAFNGILFVNGNAGIVSGSVSSAGIVVTGVPVVANPGNASGTFGATNNVAVVNAIYTVTAGTPVTITYAVNSTGTTGSAIGFTYCVIPTS